MGNPLAELAGKRLLVFNPYPTFESYGLWDLTIGTGAHVRGAEVRYVTCGAWMPECARFRPAFGLPRPNDPCPGCRSKVAERLSYFPLPTIELGAHLVPADREAAIAWLATLDPHQFPVATADGRPLGAWMLSSVRTHFRMAMLDLADPEVASAYRGYLETAFLTVCALGRILDMHRPDAMLLFNGRLDMTRVALEIAKERGVRVLVFEGGWNRDLINFWENESCESMQAFKHSFEAWRDVPLAEAQLREIESYLEGRRTGATIGHRFISTQQSIEAVRERLGLRAERPLWVGFTSSEDEIVASESRWSAFENQLEAFERLVSFAARHPELDLVLRMHPNTAGRFAIGANQQQLELYLSRFSALPPNVRLVKPEEPIDTYALMAAANLGLAYLSTAGLEMACFGKPVVVLAGADYEGVTGLTVIRGGAELEPRLEELLAAPASPESRLVLRRDAYRFAYHYFVRQGIALPLVKMERRGETNDFELSLALTAPAALLPGGTPELDRILALLFGKERWLAPPDVLEQFVSARAESAFFGLPEPEVPCLAGANPTTYLHLSSWRESLWCEVLAAYVSAFEAGTPVSLVLWADPDQGVPIEAIVAAIEAELAKCCPGAAPDVWLISDPLTPFQLAELHTVASHVVPAGDPLGEHLARLAGRPALSPSEAFRALRASDAGRRV